MDGWHGGATVGARKKRRKPFHFLQTIFIHFLALIALDPSGRHFQTVRHLVMNRYLLYHHDECAISLESNAYTTCAISYTKRRVEKSKCDSDFA